MNQNNTKTSPTGLTMEQVESASHYQLCYWYRFLPSGTIQIGDPVSDRLIERYRSMGGMTPQISKDMEW